MYQHFEPLLFLLQENAVSASVRIHEIAKYNKEGTISEKFNWFSDNSYYLKNTIYKLLLPISIFKLMQRQLTMYDIEIIPVFLVYYNLAKALYFSFANDFDLARSSPRIEYDPDFDDDLDEKFKNESKYQRQGLYIGEIDILSESLIVSESGFNRLISFGEFEYKFWNNPVFGEDPLDKYFEKIKYVFLNFHPRNRPVLWRILLTQYYIYCAIIKIQKIKTEDNPDFRVLEKMSSQNRFKFDWRNQQDRFSDTDAIVNPFEAVENFIQNSDIKIYFNINSTTESSNNSNDPSTESIGAPLRF